MQITFRMTLRTSVVQGRGESIELEKPVDWPPDLRMPVKDDVIDIGIRKAVEEVHLHPEGQVTATVFLEDFFTDDVTECAGIDFPDWKRETDG